jgi:hypothetical protein
MLKHCKKCDYNSRDEGREEGRMSVSPKIFLSKKFCLTNRFWNPMFFLLFLL